MKNLTWRFQKAQHPSVPDDFYELLENGNPTGTVIFDNRKYQQGGFEITQFDGDVAYGDIGEGIQTLNKAKKLAESYWSKNRGWILGCA